MNQSERTQEESKRFPWSFEKTKEYVLNMTTQEPVKGQYLTRAFTGCLIFLVRRLSWRATRRLGRVIGRLLNLFRIRKNIAMVNLDIAFGETKTRKEKDAIYKESLLNLGCHILNYLRVPLMDDQFWREFEFENEQLLKDAYNRGKGIIFIGGHIGEWEIAAGRVGMAGYPISIVAKRLPNPFTNHLIVNARLNMNLGTVPHRDSMKRVLEGLGRGEGVIMAVDQNMKRSQGVFVQWLGRVASTVRSNAWVARETGAPVLAGYACQTKQGKFKLVVSEEVPWEPYPGDPDQELIINTQNQVKAVERIIYQHPEQWHWIHRRWKVQPEGTPNPYLEL